MRSERWYWLPGFCCLALLINFILVETIRFYTRPIRIPQPAEIEVTLQPLPPQPLKPQPEAKPILKPEQPEQPTREPKPAPIRIARRVAVPVRPRLVARRRVSPEERPVRMPIPVLRRSAEARATSDRDRVAPLLNERPTMQGLRTARAVSRPHLDRLLKVRPAIIASASPAPGADRRSSALRPDTPAASIGYGSRRAGGGIATRVSTLGNPSGGVKLTSGNPLAGAATPDDRPTPFGVPGLHRSAGAPGLRALGNVGPLPGGGTPAPGRRSSLYSGAASPEAPSATGSYGGSHAGGQRITLAAPGAVAGGGRTLLSTNNPLAHVAIPDDRPGLGPGSGGGGAGGRGGSRAVMNLRGNPGFGGAAAGNGGGGSTRGRGRGMLAEQPGATGKGTGYGGGTGYGAGRHLGAGVPGAGAGRGHSPLPGGNLLAKYASPDDRPGPGPSGGGGGASGTPGNGALTRLRGLPGKGDLPAGTAGGPGGRGGRGLSAETPGAGGSGYGRGKGNGLARGVPFSGDLPPGEGVPLGDTSGLLRGVKGLGDAIRPERSGGGSVHVVCLLDTSASMKQSNKIGKAKEALKGFLSELLPGDSFDIINFDSKVYAFQPDLVLATDDNIKRAKRFVDGIRAHGLTNLSDAMQTALEMRSANQVVLMSDGEPEGGIENFEDLRRFIRERNTQHLPIRTVALGLGVRFPGMVLLRDIAQENGGKYDPVDLSKP